MILFTSLIITFVIVVHTVMMEKDAKVVGAMRVIGLSEGAYWLSWYTALLVPSFVFTLVGAAIAYAARARVIS